MAQPSGGRLQKLYRRVKRHYNSLGGALLDKITVPKKKVDPTRVPFIREACAKRLGALEKGPKIFYALTPQDNWPNIGDHAQVVAILRWMRKHYPNHRIIDISKDEAIACIDIIGKACSHDDLFILHSGGNLGDRGIWSETGRRSIIRAFPNNRILSLPQTISFSDTSLGKKQKKKTAQIYGRHKHLMVVSRDMVSARLAETLFPRAIRAAMPDFVLSLNPAHFGVDINEPTNGRILACLRNDDESNIGLEQRKELLGLLGENVTLYDTHMDEAFDVTRRDEIIADTLRLFASHDCVVTDRFHGTIFSVLCRKPTVIMPTVDHKLTSGVAWFKEINSVAFCDGMGDVPTKLAFVRAQKNITYPDFNELYFDQLPELFAGA